MDTIDLVYYIFGVFIILSLVGAVTRQAHDDEGCGWLQSIGLGIVVVIGGGVLLVIGLYIVANLLSIVFGYGAIPFKWF